MATFNFTPSNIFQIGWDLNPLAAQTGIPRDTLSEARDTFIQPRFAAYRAAALASGGAFRADEGDQNLFNDPMFQNYVQTGNLPTGRNIGLNTGIVAAVGPAGALAGPVPASGPNGLQTIRPQLLGTSPLSVAGFAPPGGLNPTTLLLLAALAGGGYFLLKRRG